MPRLFHAFCCVALFAPAFAGPPAPRTPEAERAGFRLAPGLRIDCIAAEPLVQSPVACAFDERGRLWVVEMLDYPNGPAPGAKPEGRVKILTDADGDGRYDAATVFADGLLFANGVLPWGNGAIVTAAPHILYLKDADGDGRADTREVLYTGFAAGNPQLRVSHPALGPDGWVVVANGLRGGEVRPGDGRGPAVPLAGKDFRFDPARKLAGTVPGMGQFGNAFDRWGHRFVCDNRNHLRHAVFPTDPGANNPLLAAPALVEDTAGPVAGAAGIHPLSRNWTTSNLHAGQFTAACGVHVDRGGLLPAPYAGMAFTCEPTGNLVHAETLTPAGATFRSRPWRDGVEFLASAEEWFRPVSVAPAPDGSLVVVDMYRAVVEHPEFMPDELKNRPDLLLGKNSGRLWRIAPEGAPPGGPAPKLAGLPTAELVARLGDENGWVRATAQRLLLTSADTTLAERLATHAAATDSPDGLILAAWLLESKGADTTAAVARMAGHANPRVREHAARMLGDAPRAARPVPAALAALAGDADARVRFQAALSIGAFDHGSAVVPLAGVGARDAADRWARLAVASGSAGRSGAVVAALLGRPISADVRQLVRELSKLVGGARNPVEIAAFVDALASADAATRRAGVAGLAEGVARRGTPFAEFALRLPDAAKAQELVEASARPASDPAAPTEERAEAVKLLAHTPWESARPVLTELLANGGTPPSLRSVAVRALAAHPRPEVAPLLLDGWKSATPAARADALDALVARADRAAALLDAVEAGRVRPADVDPARARRLTSHPNAVIAGRAKRLLKDSLPADRAAVLAAYRPALALPADAARGREVFRRSCAACHSVAGVGVAVGPDVSDTRTKTPEMLLGDILTPNAAVDGNYLSYSISTADGRALTGLIAGETPGALTIKIEGGKLETVLRADVDEVRATGLSLMPDGLEKGMSVRDVADLIRFLKDWRYLDGAVPRGAHPR